MPTTVRLAAPIIAGFVGQMLMGLADSVMVGRVGAVPLAACAFANTVTSVFFVFGFGAMSAVAVCSSNAHGAGNVRASGEVLVAGTALSVFFSVVLGLVLLMAFPFFHLLGQPPEVVREAHGYLVLVSFSLLPTLLFCCGKAFSESLSRPWMPFWIVIGTVLLNVGLNWVFIFGNLGSPAMGLTGAGLATLLARVLEAIWIYAVLLHSPSYSKYVRVGWRWEHVQTHFGRLLRLGLPSGFQVLGEVGAFAFASLMLGWIGVTALAAHQVAITCAATTFMIPLGLSIALTVRLGQELGARRFDLLKPVTLSAVFLTLAVMTLGALLFFTLGRQISEVFVSDAAVVELAARLLVIAGIFQIFDGIQVVSVGGLRGLHDVRIPMVLTYFHYWGVALPLSAALAFWFDWGAVGIWYGLAGGLAVAAVVLGTRLWSKLGAGEFRTDTTGEQIGGVDA